MSRKLNETYIPTDGLVYRADLDGSVPSGSTASNITWVAADRGYVEEVASFNGSSSRVTSTATHSSEITINFWINGTNAPSSSIYSKGISYNNVALDFSYDHLDANFKQSFSIFNGSIFFSCGLNETLVGGKWYMLSCTFNGTSIKSYLNGVFQNETAYSGSVQNRTLLDIGRYGLSGGNQYFNGKIGLFKEYNRILSQQEISALYNEGLRKLGPTHLLDRSQGFPKYSLPNLESSKVLEISRPANSGIYYDQTGNGNNGTATNVTDSTIGLHNVMSFNGGSSFINVSSTQLSTLLNGRNPFSISIWIKLNTLTAGQVILDTRGSDYNGLYIELNSSGKFIVARSNGVTNNIIATCNDTSVVGTWCNFIVTYDGTNGKMYRDGVEQTGGTSTLTLNSNGDFKIGKGFAGNSSFGYLNGNLNDIKIYEKTLTNKQVEQLYYSSFIIN